MSEARESSSTELAIGRLDAPGAAGILEDLVRVYNDVYAELNDPFFGEERYRQQITGHMTNLGWQAVVGRIGGEIVGYAYGFPLQPKTSWWTGLLSEVTEGFTTETGNRTFAISEIMVRKHWRRRGIARMLHDQLLSERTEPRSTLLVEPENVAAQRAYAEWGWEKVGRLRPGWDGAPTYDVLIRAR